ncbi:MAG: MATE family efflux transporter [Hahellaceae bacterium]|nr:MATE family efflux transporter [Hahellaceae bacterium]MCP5212952.1 MATE family efflux transporter [Hahellaceae bacterium]
MLFGVLSLMSFQLVDSAFIGQLGVDPLAALGFTIPVYQLIIGIQVGLGIATTAVISRALGQEDIAHAKNLGGVVILMGALVIALTCLSLWFFKVTVATALGAEAFLLPTIIEYWHPWLFSAWTGAMLYFGYSISRANGNTLLPGLVMVFCSLLNIALDPIFIFYFDFGLPGAAYASITSFLIGGVVVFRQIYINGWVSFTANKTKLTLAVKQLNAITMPATLSQFMPALSAMLATAIIAAYGATVVAAWGLGTRLEFFSIVVVLALTMSLPPMVGKLLGKNKFNDIDKLVKIAASFVLVWQLLIGLIWLVTSGLIAPLLSADLDISSIVVSYMQLVPFSYSALGICMLMVSVCNALGMPLRALLISLVRLFVCYLPLLWLGAKMYGLTGIFCGAFLGNIMAGLLAWLTYRKTITQLIEKQRAINELTIPAGIS